MVRVDGFCGKMGLDLTVGCEHTCAYCHFSRYQQVAIRQTHRGDRLDRRLAIDEFLSRSSYPRELYLSPLTDPCAPAATEGARLVLQRILPRGVKVILSTKGIIPRPVWLQLARFPDQVRLVFGITSLDDQRNAVIEPGCPRASARLTNFRLAQEHGVTRVTARIDPLLPGVDDREEELTPLLDRLAEEVVQSVTASYLFLWPNENPMRLTHTPLLREAAAFCTEPAPVGRAPDVQTHSPGEVLSVSLKHKCRMYRWLHEECRKRGLLFSTCGCKDLRLKADRFPTACFYPDSAHRHRTPTVLTRASVRDESCHVSVSTE
jgi:DNA repair photolyase